MDFVCEVSANRKAVYLNFLFWAQFDFTPQGLDAQQRDATIASLRDAWEFNHIEYRFRRATERKTPLRSAYSFGITTSGWLFLRNITTIAASSIAGSQIHRSSLCRMANSRGVKKRVRAIGETRTGVHGRK